MKGRGVPFPPKRAKAPLGRHGREKRGLSPITDTAVKNVVCPLLRLTPLTPEVGRGFTATDGGALKLRPTTAPYGFGGQRVSRIRNGGRALISSNNCARYAPSTPMPSRLAEPKNSTTTVSDVHPDTATPVTHE